MKTLGANAIRVYHVDSTADHTGCMSAFANVGIYLFVDLDTFITAIDPVSFPPFYVYKIIKDTNYSNVGRGCLDNISI
jgi:Glucanosyltransferase